MRKDGFVQVCSAKIQPEPAKMPIVMLCINSSGEGGFSFIDPKSISPENDDDHKITSLCNTFHTQR